MDEVEGERRILYTVGHSNHTLDMFLGLLHQHGIDVLADTRSRPHSEYVPHFNHDVLKPAIANAGLRFVFWGRELGGRPVGAEFYDAQGHVLYDRVAGRADFQQAVSELEKGAVGQKIALLCSEENPAGCHRRLLVARVLAQRGAQIAHIRADGRLQSEAELQAEENAAASAKDGGQQALFDAEENKAWKSVRPVRAVQSIPSIPSIPSASRKRPRGSSSRP